MDRSRWSHRLWVVTLLFGWLAGTWRFVVTPVLLIRESAELPQYRQAPGVVTLVSRYSSSSEHGRTDYTYAFGFRYIVGGERYFGTRYALRCRSLRFLCDYGVDLAVARLKKGDRVIVLHHPEDPTRALLSPRPAGREVWVDLALGAGLILAPPVALWIRHRRRGRREALAASCIDS